MKVNRHKLENKQFQEKYGKLFEGVKIKHMGSLKIYFGPMFFLRRYLFVVFPYIFNTVAVLQIQSICLITEIYIIFYMVTRPHASKMKTNLEVFYDIIVMFMIYHMICFTDFNLDLHAKFQMGYPQIFLIAFLTALNILVMIIS